MGIDIGKNSFHVVGLDQRGAIVVRQKWSRNQIEARLAAMRRSNNDHIRSVLTKKSANGMVRPCTPDV